MHELSIFPVSFRDICVSHHPFHFPPCTCSSSILLQISVSMPPSPQTTPPRYTKLSCWFSFFPSSLISRSFSAARPKAPPSSLELLSVHVYQRFPSTLVVVTLPTVLEGLPHCPQLLPSHLHRSTFEECPSYSLSCWSPPLLRWTTVGLGHYPVSGQHPPWIPLIFPVCILPGYSTICLFLCASDHPHLHLWDTNPPQRGHGHISHNCFVCLFKVYESQSHILLSLQSLFHQLSQGDHTILHTSSSFETMLFFSHFTLHYPPYPFIQNPLWHLLNMTQQRDTSVFSRVMNISLPFPYRDYQPHPSLLWDLPFSNAGF